MRNQMSSYSILPWKKPENLKHFVPDHSRFFFYLGNGIHVAWRSDLALIFTFMCSSFECLSTELSVQSQVISSRHVILDVVVISKSIFFVSANGLFQVLTPDDSGCLKETLESLGGSYKFSLKNAFELSPLKSILAVIAAPNENVSSFRHIFAVITCSKDNGTIDAEVYSLALNSSKIDCHLEFVSRVCNESPSNRGKCTCSFLTNYQAKHLFFDLKDAEILLVALSSGDLFCIPFFISISKHGIKPTARLVYQSQWPIDGLRCPHDGFSIFLFLEGGTVLYISPLSGELKDVRQRSLCYNTFSLPSSMKHFAAPKCHQIIVSDGITTNAVHIVSPEQTDIETIPVKGVTTLSEIPDSHFVVASTLHGNFYLLDASNMIQKTDQICHSMAGCNLDVSLQLVEDMKKQTELLCHYQKELEQENSIIKALSQVARASLLTDFCRVTVRVMKTVKDGDRDEDEDMSMISENTQNKYQIGVDITNNSTEDFDPSLWRMSLEIRNPDGVIITKDFVLSKTFNREFPFSSVINIPYFAGKLAFPIVVRASLVAEIMEDNLESHWLKITVGSYELNISHFFSVFFQPPQVHITKKRNLEIFLDEMQLYSPERQNTEALEQASLTSYIIPVPEVLREPKLILGKLLYNCQHRHNFSVEEDTCNQGDKTVMWVQIFQNVVKLVFRKSCAAITLSCTDLQVLHAVKLWLTSVLSVTDPLEEPSSCSTSGFIKAKNLNAVLETLPFEETYDTKQLLVIHQDLRNNVSSQIY